MTTSPDGGVPRPRKVETVPRVSARTVASTAMTVGLIFGLAFVLSLTLLIDLIATPLMRLPTPWLLLVGAGAVPFMGHALKKGAQWQARVLCLGIAVLILVLVVPWSQRKVFVFDLFRVARGMTIDEVEDVMGGYLQGIGSELIIPADAANPPSTHGSEDGVRWRVSGKLTYRWDDEIVDLGTVRFVDGRVTTVHFSPD